MAGLIAIPILLYLPCLLHTGLLPTADLETLHLPLRTMLLREWDTVRVSAWNPYLFGGFPFLADPFVAAHYPPHRLLAWLMQDPARHLAGSLVLHLALAGMGGFLFLRLRLAGAAATAGAVLWSTSGFVTGHAGDPTLVITLAWLPWLAYFVERSTRNGFWLIGASVVLGLIGLGGTWRGLSLALLAVAVHMVAAAGRAQIGHRPAPLGWSLRVASTAIIAMGLAAIQWLPSLSLVRASVLMDPDLAPRTEGGLSLVASFLLPDRNQDGGTLLGYDALAVTLMAWPLLSRSRKVAVAVVLAVLVSLLAIQFGERDLLPPWLLSRAHILASIAALAALMTA